MISIPQQLTFEMIQHHKWPRLPWSQRRELPHCAAIYLVIGAEDEVLYVGQTRSLLLRFQAHHRKWEFSKLPQLSIAWLVCSDEAMLPAIEAALIAHFVPPYNKKTGPAKQGWEDTHVLLPPYLIDWAKEYPEGMGALVRRLLKEEYERQQAKARVS